MRALVRLNRIPRLLGLYRFGLYESSSRLSDGSCFGCLVPKSWSRSIFLGIFNTPYFAELYVVRSYEPYTVELFKAAIGPHATVLDLGAHIGAFCLIAS
jgi:hypothetical protein